MYITMNSKQIIMQFNYQVSKLQVKFYQLRINFEFLMKSLLHHGCNIYLSETCILLYAPLAYTFITSLCILMLRNFISFHMLHSLCTLKK